MNNIQSYATDVTSLHVLTIYVHPNSVTIHAESFMTSVSICRPPAHILRARTNRKSYKHRSRGPIHVYPPTRRQSVLYISFHKRAELMH